MVANLARLVPSRATPLVKWGTCPRSSFLCARNSAAPGSRICFVYGEKMKRLFLAFVLLTAPVAAWCQAPASGSAKPSKAQQVSPFADYVGDWISTLDGKVWLLLQLELHGERINGFLTHSRDLEMNDEGGLRSASDEKVKEAITDATLNPDGLLITVKYADAEKTDQYMMRLTTPGQVAELKMVAQDMPPGMPKPKPWALVNFRAVEKPAPK